jgi:hypothetical protein
MISLANHSLGIDPLDIIPLAGHSLLGAQQAVFSALRRTAGACHIGSQHPAHTRAALSRHVSKVSRTPACLVVPTAARLLRATLTLQMVFRAADFMQRRTHPYASRSGRPAAHEAPSLPWSLGRRSHTLSAILLGVLDMGQPFRCNLPFSVARREFSQPLLADFGE